MTIRIDRLHEGEGARLRRIRLRSLKEAPEAFASTYEETAARPEPSWRQQLRELATFVAVHEGQDRGIVRGAPHHEVPGEAFLISMWVAPEARGQGLGRALIEALIAWARAEGYARLLLDVGDTNAPAIALYERMGFLPTGERGALPPPREAVTEHRRARDL